MFQIFSMRILLISRPGNNTILHVGNSKTEIDEYIVNEYFNIKIMCQNFNTKCLESWKIYYELEILQLLGSGQ